jgi:hypothetical protein
MQTSLTYARARLFLGISNVGFWVLCALFVLLQPQILPANPSIFVLPLVLIMGNLPFDTLGGYVLPKHFGRLPETITPAKFINNWIRGVLVQYICFVWFMYAINGVIGVVPKTILVLCIQGMLWVGQCHIACLTGNLCSFDRSGDPRFIRLSDDERTTLLAHPFLENQSVPSIVFLSSTDSGFVGGWCGTILVLPSAWQRELSSDILATQILRRIGTNKSGARMRGVVLAVAFNTAGFALSLIYGYSLVSIIAINTLWAFLGVLTLPTLSRGAVFTADRFALDAGVPTEALRETIVALDKRQDDEPERSQGIEAIFHPIPSVNRRLASLERKDKTHTQGGWQTLRTALYLSWASGSFLSRAVHCNIGRPELWVFFPGD